MRLASRRLCLALLTAPLALVAYRTMPAPAAPYRALNKNGKLDVYEARR